MSQPHMHQATITDPDVKPEFHKKMVYMQNVKGCSKVRTIDLMSILDITDSIYNEPLI